MEAQPQARSPWGAPPPPAPAPGGYAAPGGFGQGGFGGGGFGAPQGGGGGFLRSAMTTAAGVAGGALLFQGISNLFSSHHGANTMFAGQSLTDQLAGGTDPSSIGKDIFTQPSDAGAQPASFSDNLGPNSDPGFGDQGYGDQGFVDDATFQDDGELDGGNDGGDWT
jgi:hypothetical protein